jgi:hypothetical protein
VMGPHTKDFNNMIHRLFFIPWNLHASARQRLQSRRR